MKRGGEEISFGYWPYVTALVITGVWLFVLSRIVIQQRSETLPDTLPDVNAREKAAADLWELYPAFPDDEPDTALFLLAESKYAYEGWVETNGRLEAKATSLLGFLAGGAGVLTVLATVHGPTTRLTFGPFLILALSSAFGALASCLYVLRPKLRPHPTVSDYVTPLIANSSRARFHLALSLAEGYNAACLQIAKLRRYDPIAWTAAQYSLAVAVLAALLHLTVSVLGSTEGKDMVLCRGQQAPYHHGEAWKTSCKES